MSATKKLIPLADIAKKAHVDPRTARRRLRNAGSKVPYVKGEKRWVFTPSQVPVIKDYIRD